MNGRLLSMLKVLISMVYCFIIGVVIALLGFSFEVGLFVGAFITLILGGSALTAGGPMMPIMGNASNQNSIDSANLRSTMMVNTLVNEAENELPEGNMFKSINNKKGTPLEYPSMSGIELAKELLYRRNGVQQIIAGMLVAVIAFMPYLKYFL